MSLIESLKPDAAAWKAGLRAAAAAGIALAISHLLGLPQGYWAVLTAIIVLQASIGASLKAVSDRFLGTLAGAAVGFVIASLTPSTNGGNMVALVLSTGLLTVLASRKPFFRIAPMTAAMVLIASPSHAEAWVSALHRVTEIGLGCLIGIAVALVVAPSRAAWTMRDVAAAILPKLAKLITLEMQGSVRANEAELTAVSEEIYAAYDKIDVLAEEAHQEEQSRVTQTSFDADRLRRGLLGLRTSALYLRRVSSLPWPAQLGKILEPPTQAITEAIAHYLLALGPAMASGAPPPDLAALEKAYTQFHDVARGAKLEHFDVDTEQSEANPGRAAAFVSAFTFSLEQVRASIEELAQCVTEMAEASAK